MKRLSIILFFISSFAAAQNSTVGYVLLMDDGSVRLPNGSITNSMLNTGISPAKILGLEAALQGKQDVLVSGVSIKTINGGSILGNGNIDIAGGVVAWGGITGTLSNQSDLNTALGAKEPTLQAGLPSQYYRGDKSWQTLDKTSVGLSNVDNTSDANKPLSNAVVTALASKQNTITVLPFENGGISGAAATSATTGVMTVNMNTNVITITPTGNCTFNASGGVAGQRVTFCITTSGTSSFTLTFGTNFRKVGTLATGTTNARFFSVTFICINGVIWQEIGRTAAQT